MGVLICGTFDAALARNELRKIIAEKGWQPSYRAKVTAALTALTEIIVLSQTPGTLNINVIDRGNSSGIELICDVKWMAAKQAWVDQVQKWLERAADDIAIEDRVEGTRIKATVWGN